MERRPAAMIAQAPINPTPPGWFDESRHDG
jgi:hypothetical protein